MELTASQKSILTREMQRGKFEPFIMLTTAGEDRIAKNLVDKGLGMFANNGFHYPWRSRNGYTNNFYLNDAGLKLREELAQ